MVSMDKSRLMVVAFLAFCVLSSKHILIYNEETLVALSFFLFVWFVFRYFGATIRDSLEERSGAIAGELQNYLQVEAAGCHALLEEHGRVAGVATLVQTLSGWTGRELASFQALAGQAVANRCRHQVDARLRTAALSRVAVQHHLQGVVADSVLRHVLAQWRSGGGPSTRPGVAVQQAIALLARAGR